MAQTEQLILSLKKSLKAHGLTYADVAKQLSLSEASIKRLFSEQNLTLERLDQICQMMELQISDLVQIMSKDNRFQIDSLSREQEQELASNPELVLVTVCVLNGWSMQQLIDSFHLTETQCIRHLARLDRLKLIELLPKNRIKLRVTANFKWLENGPIQQFFQEKIQADYFRSRFEKNNERLIVANAMLSDATNTVFQRKMEQLVRELDELNHNDAQLPLDERLGTTVVLAIRNWDYGIFDSFQKNQLESLSKKSSS